MLTPTPEQTAEGAVAVVWRGGTCRVELRVQGLPAVCVCGHPNPAVVREHAEAIRRFLAAVIRADREESGR